MGAFQENIVVRILTSPNRLRGPDPQSLLANQLKRARYDRFTPSQSGRLMTSSYSA